ncbi:MAG: phosphonopyruvate decarboxylase [Hyphomicrobiales bacterium]
MDAKSGTETWQQETFNALKGAGVDQVGYVPDAGHTRLIELCVGDKSITTNVLTTEEEGIAIAAGAWLGGSKSCLLMQSSGVGNCINMLSLSEIGRFPLLMLVTMRGEWHEFNPWQMPMAKATETSLNAIGVDTVRVDDAHDLASIVSSSADLAFNSDQRIAVLMSQRMLGSKKW